MDKASTIAVADTLRAALNVLRDSVESGRMPSGLALDAGARAVHQAAAERVEQLLGADRGPIADEIDRWRRPLSDAPRAFLVALDFAHADNSARIDWGWPRVGPNTWQSAAGELVRYLADTGGKTLAGLPMGSPLYLGFAWSGRGDAREIRRLLHAGRFVERQPS
jgi:hypothetical protein